MKNFFLILSLFILVTIGLRAQQPYTWIPLSTPTTQNLKSVYFVDSLTGWAAGKAGVILKTTDGGDNWILQNSGTTSDIIEIFMLNHQQGWMIGNKVQIVPGEPYGSYFLNTTNGGDLWTVTEFPNEIYYSIYFHDSLKGWLGGEDGRMYGTEDGGVRWFEATVESSLISHLPVRKIRFWSPQFGIAVGGFREFSGVVWRTINGGESWAVIRTFEELSDFHFIDSLNILAVGGGVDDGAGRAISADGGLTWDFEYIGPFGIAGAVGKRFSHEAFAPLLNTGTYIHTLDTGETWTQWNSPNGMRLTDVVFTDDRHGYMVGDTGTVLRYNPPQLIEVKQHWNIISLPVSVVNPDKDILFPTAISNAFSFTESGYTATDSILTGAGYWLKFSSAQSIEIGGFPIAEDTITVRAGWNMVGALTFPVAVASLISEPPSLNLSSFYGYTNGYYISNTLYPGYGYWVKSDADGVIYLNAKSVMR